MQQAKPQPHPYVRTDEATDLDRITFTAAQVLAIAMAAYERGRFDGDLHEMSATVAELAEPRLTREQRVARRVAGMTHHAQRIYATLGKPAGYRYRGGPVNWDNGLPLGSACAWLRSTPFRREQQRVAA